MRPDLRSVLPTFMPTFMPTFGGAIRRPIRAAALPLALPTIALTACIRPRPVLPHRRLFASTGQAAQLAHLKFIEVNEHAALQALGQDDVVALLEATLADEHAANELLTDISADAVLPAALASADESDFEEEGDEAPVRAPAGKGATGRRTR